MGVFAMSPLAVLLQRPHLQQALLSTGVTPLRRYYGPPSRFPLLFPVLRCTCSSGFPIGRVLFPVLDPLVGFAQKHRRSQARINTVTQTPPRNLRPALAM